MGLIKQNCDPDLLKMSLSEQLPQEAEDRLIAHLDACQVCRNQLEELAGGKEDWSSIESILKQESGGDTLHWSVISDSVTPIPTDFAVDFLSPSERKGSIGRLDDIEIQSVIGHGGNGIVLKGYQPELKRLVAVKVMAPALAATAAARQRFAREAQATAAVVHPNVMPILTVHSEGQLPYLVMPFVDCESLQQRLDREGCLSVSDVLRIAHQVASGLAAAHAQGLVHRDVKPANILLEKRVNRVMLTDFGLARAADDASLTRTGLIAGTPAYMSPEQARGDLIDARSDLFSLGSVMYAMATGRPPFRAETVYGILRRVTDETPRPTHEINSDIPLWLSVLVARFQHAIPEERISDSETAADILQDCLAHVQQPAAFALPDTVRQMQSEDGRRKLLQRAAPFVQLPYLLIAMLVVAVGVMAFQRSAPEEQAETPVITQKATESEQSQAKTSSSQTNRAAVDPVGIQKSSTDTFVASGEDTSSSSSGPVSDKETETASVEQESLWSDDVGSDLWNLDIELSILDAELSVDLPDLRREGREAEPVPEKEN